MIIHDVRFELPDKKILDFSGFGSVRQSIIENLVSVLGGEPKFTSKLAKQFEEIIRIKLAEKFDCEQFEGLVELYRY